MSYEDKAKEQLIREIEKLRMLVHDQKKSEGSLLTDIPCYDRVRFVESILDIASRFISVFDFDAAVNVLLDDVGKVTRASRTYLFQIRDEGSKLDNTHEWCADGVDPQIDNLQGLSSNTFPWWLEKLRTKEVIHIEDVSQMPEEAQAERAILEAQNIKSLLVFPVFVKDKLAGFMGLDDVARKGPWSDKDIALLRLISEIVGRSLGRAEIEKALKIKEYAIDTSVNAIGIAGLDGVLTYANNAFVTMLGYSDVREVVGRAVEEFTQPQTIAHEVNNAIKEKGNWVGELQLQRKDGSSFDIYFSGNLIKDDAGNPLCMMSSFIDISMLKAAEKALRESEEKFVSIFQDVNDAIAVTDLRAMVTEVNNRTVILFGYSSREEIIGKSAFSFIVEKERNTAREVIEKTIRQGSQRQLYFTMVRKDGTEFQGEINVGIYQNSSGKRKGFITIIRDITERRRIEEEMKRYATMDALTDVYNRRSGLLLLKQQIQLAKRNNTQLCVCYVDTDFLKAVNDIYGHAEGDDVLKTVSASLKDAVRKIDIVCRLGGDEFLLVLPQCTVQQAYAIWDRIEGKITVFNDKKSKPYSISLSRGFAEYDPANDRSADQLIMIADKEMYTHKRTKFRE
jgi:diguanylate cyclase (GGDEF)-like protein/PAS domain S-box-containing protein